MEASPSTVLLIEDSPVQAKIVRKQFEAFSDFPVLIAHDLQEAEACLTERGAEIFLAVVDLNLPDAPNGEAADLCLRWKMPTLVLTASINEEMRQSFLDRNVADFFFKGSMDEIAPLIFSVERLYKNRGITALAVDDSATQRAIISKYMKIQGLNVLTAGGGEEALKVVDANPNIKLVVTDFEMPDMDGIALARALRERFLPEAMAIVGVSSAGSGSLTARFLKNGANDFLTKPFEAEEFYWRINQTLNVLEMMQLWKERRKGGNAR